MLKLFILRNKILMLFIGLIFFLVLQCFLPYGKSFCMNMQNKTQSVVQYLNYQYRVLIGRDGIENFSNEFGFLLGVKGKNFYYFTPVNDKNEVKQCVLANISISKDVNLLTHRNESVKLELYQTDGKPYCLVWLEDRTLLNLKLVEEGHARPIENPDSNAIDKIFAAYYLKNIKE